MALDAPRGASAAGQQRAGAAGARVGVGRLRRCVSDHVRTITAPRRGGPRGSSQGSGRRIPMRDGTDVFRPTVPRDCARKERYSLMILNAASNVSVYEWHCMTGTVWAGTCTANLGTGEARTGEGCTGERRTGARCTGGHRTAGHRTGRHASAPVDCDLPYTGAFGCASYTQAAPVYRGENAAGSTRPEV